MGQHAGETSSVSGAEDLIDPLIIGDEDVGDDAADDSFMPPRDVLDQSRLPDLNGLSKKAGSNMKGASADKRKDKRQRPGMSRSNASKKLFAVQESLDESK